MWINGDWGNQTEKTTNKDVIGLKQERYRYEFPMRKCKIRMHGDLRITEATRKIAAQCLCVCILASWTMYNADHSSSVDIYKPLCLTGLFYSAYWFPIKSVRRTTIDRFIHSSQHIYICRKQIRSTTVHPAILRAIPTIPKQEAQPLSRLRKTP